MKKRIKCMLLCFHLLICIPAFASDPVVFEFTEPEPPTWLMAIDPKFVDALPTAFMKPLSGSGARAMMIETMNTHGVDSFAARVAATIQGSTETTFYVLAVYFGSVGIKRIRHALSCGLIADLAGIVTAILVSYWFYA